MISVRFVFAVLAIAAVAGFGSAYAVIVSQWRPGTMSAGPWLIGPRDGARDADPYTRAEIARESDLPLGLGEGLTFRADRDDSGRRLQGGCTYRVRGTLPTARAWTLTLVTASNRLHANPAARYGFSSAEVLRTVDGRIDIGISPEAVSGDWLPAPADEPFQLVLRLYDTPVAAVSGSLRADSLPRITREMCL